MAMVTDLRIQIQGILEYALKKNSVSCSNLIVTRKQNISSREDLVVPIGCHSAVDNDVLLSLRKDLNLQLQSAGIPVTKVSGDKWNSFIFYLNRTECFKKTISSVLKANHYGHRSSKLAGTVLINVVQPVQKKSSNKEETVSLDWIRAHVIQQHLQLLFRAHGHTVQSVADTSDSATFQRFLKYLCIDQDILLPSESDRYQINQTVDYLKQHTHVTKLEWESRDYAESTDCNSPRSGDETKSQRLDGTSQQCTLSVFDLKRYVKDHEFTFGRTNFDKNLTVCNVTSGGKPSEVCRQACMLDLETQKTGASICVHVVGQSQSFQQQKVHLMLHALIEGDSRDCGCRQTHVVFGPVIPRKDCTDTEVTNGNQYISLRYQQMREAAVMKYGDSVKGEGWEETLQSLTAACIKFELLCTVARNTVKVNLSQGETDSGGELTSGGSFVMYNCARLATLFAHYEEAVTKGIYPALPAVEDIDWSTLREEAEWTMLIDYVDFFPEVVQQSVQELTPSDSIHAKVSTHKLCQFLCSLSRTLSSYYSRYHVLGEGRAHLLPTMFARLYLLKAVYQVMVNGLALLGIQPLSQL